MAFKTDRARSDRPLLRPILASGTSTESIYRVGSFRKLVYMVYLLGRVQS